jgi:hypothetical protein
MAISATSGVVVAATILAIAAVVIAVAAPGEAVAVAVVAVATTVVATVVITPIIPTTAAIVAVSATAVVAAAVPGAGANKDASDKVVRAVKAIRGAFVGVVVVVSIRANGSCADVPVSRTDSNVKGNLRLCVTCSEHENAK